MEGPPEPSECLICHRPHPSEAMMAAGPWLGLVGGVRPFPLSSTPPQLSPYCLRRLLRSPPFRRGPLHTLYTTLRPRRAKRGGR